MRSLLRLAVILICVQRGDGRGLRPPMDEREEAASSHPSPREARRSRHTEASGLGPSPDSPSDPPSDPSAPSRARRSAPDPQCGLRSILLQVRDLGLGYESDETVLFKYCGGTCPRVRSNHDLTLSSLLLSGVLPHPPPGQGWHDAPCCRPTHHEDMAFLDNSHRWHKVEKLSAAGCSCVG